MFADKIVDRRTPISTKASKGNVFGRAASISRKGYLSR